MEFRILGPVEIWCEGRRMPLRGAKQRTALATLLLADGKVVSDARLAEMMWGIKMPRTVNQQIYTHICRLRKLLGPDIHLLRHQPGYLLQLGSATFDYADFHQLASMGYEKLTTRRYDDASILLSAALAIWRGPALGNVTEHLALTYQPRLNEMRMAMIENRIEADLALGRHSTVVAELTGLVEEHPLRERLRIQLMIALYQCGRQADALAVYHRGRQLLAEEFGIDPSSTLNSIFQAILTGDLPARRVPRSAAAGLERRLATSPARHAPA